MDEPGREAFLWLVLPRGRVGDVVAAGAHELQHARQVQAYAILRDLGRCADVCTAEASELALVPCVLESLVQFARAERRGAGARVRGAGGFGGHSSNTVMPKASSSLWLAAVKSWTVDAVLPIAKWLDAPLGVRTVT